MPARCTCLIPPSAGIPTIPPSGSCPVHAAPPQRRCPVTPVGDDAFFQFMTRRAIEITEPQPESVTCPECGMTSHHPQDVAQGWCANCRAFTSEGAQT